MRKIKDLYYLLLFILLMVFLFVPIIQKRTEIFPVRPLKGVFEPTPKPELTFENYRSNTYQIQMEKYLSENFGLREPVIRLYNQYVYSVFNKTYCHFIVPGKDGYLFYALAVNEHYGNEILKHYKNNEEAITDAENEFRQMRKLRHVLKDYGIEFLAFIAPDKPEIYPEYLPRRDADTTTVHLADYFTRRMKEEGFPLVNMTDWYVNMKDTVTFPLFPKTDSHWRYSAVYGFDSLFRYINTLDGEAKFPNLHIGPPIAYESEELEGDEETMNLLFRIPGDNIKYKSEITVEKDTLHRKPKVLFVGDSFIWSMEGFMPIRELMSDKEVWFYNNTAFVGFEKATMNVKDIDRLSHILHADYVVFYSAGHQWWEATYGFAKDALLQLCVSDSLFEATVTNNMNNMRNWDGYKDYTEEELRNAAIWMLKNNPELIPGLEGEEMPSIRNTERIEKFFDSIHHEEMLRKNLMADTAMFIQIKKQELIEQWKNNPDMIQTIQKKAEERNLPFDVMMEKDAQWVINHKIANGELFQ